MASSEGSSLEACLRPGMRLRMLSIQLAALACCSFAFRLSIRLSCTTRTTPAPTAPGDTMQPSSGGALTRSVCAVAAIVLLMTAEAEDCSRP